MKTKSTQQPAPARITLPRDHPDVQAAERAGHDLGLIEDNLNLTPEQRAAQHDSALALILELDRHRESEAPGTDAERERRQREEIIIFSPRSNFLCIHHS